MQTACLLPRPTVPVLPRAGFCSCDSPEPARRLAAAVRAELAVRLHVPPASLVLESIEEASFRDTSFGFPERDGCYGPAFLDGHVVRFARGGRHYEFHGISDDIEHGLFGEMPARGTPLYWMRDERGLFVPDAG